MEAVRQLFKLAAPVSIDIADKTSHVVKGFASVETADRSDEIVPPEEFNIKSFMAKATLLFNHRYWIDDNGNGRAIGSPKEMFVARLKDIGDNLNYGVERLSDNQIVDYFPKAKCPNIGPGTKGVWVRAEVTVPKVWEMVQKGELNAFSWRGLTRVGYKTNPDMTVSKLLKNIDLYEVSLVNVPDNGASLS